MRLSVFFLLACCLCISGIAQTPERSITQIRGDLYRFQNNGHYAVFLVTSEGVITTDPINEEAAKWLKTEIKKRFNQSVKFVIYSHHHADHVSGGEVFDEATFVGHQLTKNAIEKENIPTPSPSELFTTKKTISLGGKTVELIYPGKSHSDNCIAFYFPEEKTVFAVDFISVKRLPYRTLNNSYFPDWIQAIEKVEQLDFDIFVPGHGPVGTKADVAEHRAYIDQLYMAVKKAYKEGKSLEVMKKEIRLASYQHLGQYEDWRILNIEGVYNFLKSQG